jgi:hypothetical protein
MLATIGPFPGADKLAVVSVPGRGVNGEVAIAAWLRNPFGRRDAFK